MMYNCFIINGSNRLKLHEADAGSTIKCLGTVKQPLNGIDNFTFSIYPDNPCYDSIDSMLSLAEVRRCDNGKLVYKGRVLKPTGSMESGGLASKKYISEGELSYLCDSIQPYQTISGNLVTQRFIAQALSVHNNAMPESKKIYVGRISVSGSTPSSHTWHYVSTWQAFKDYISKYGGEIRLRYGDDGKRYLDYTDTIWASGSDTPIELAVNMQSVSFTVDPTSIASGIYAVGAKLSKDGTSAKRLELGEIIWNEALRAKYGDIVACITWDDVTLASNLRRKAEDWLRDQSGELHQYSVSAVDLSVLDKDFDEFSVGTQYPIKNPLIGLDDVVRCIGRTIDINDPTKTKLTFGDKYETLTALTSARNAALSTQINNFAADITEQQQAYAQRLVEAQTALLTGAEGGYVYTKRDQDGHPTDTFFLNAPDPSTATKALRFNYMGMGFWDKSVSGGSALEGPYKDAWTIDGKFHTEFICGKEIVGFTFNNGNGTFEVKSDGSVTAKKLTVTNGSINCGDGTFKVEADGSVTAKALSITNGSINCGNGKFTVSPAGHVVAQDIELSGGSQQGGSFTNAAINCGNGKFVVTSGGNVTAQSINITGGSIDITTNSKDDDRIILKYGNYILWLTPEGVQIEGASDYYAHLDNEGLTIAKGNDTTIITQNGISCDGGAVFEGDVIVHSSAAGRNYTVGDSLKILFDRTGG